MTKRSVRVELLQEPIHLMPSSKKLFPRLDAYEKRQRAIRTRFESEITRVILRARKISATEVRVAIPTELDEAHFEKVLDLCRASGLETFTTADGPRELVLS